MGDDGKVPPIPTVRPTVERVDALGIVGGGVLIWRDVVSLTVQLKGAVLDAVRIATRNTAKMGMGLVNGVVGRIVKAHYDVPIEPVLVRDDQV